MLSMVVHRGHVNLFPAESLLSISILYCLSVCLCVWWADFVAMPCVGSAGQEKARGWDAREGTCKGRSCCNFYDVINRGH